MADWYVSSAVYNTIPQFAASTAYSVGQIIRPTTTTQTTMHTQRCTTAGTTGASQPGWATNNNGTTTSGTAVFTNVTGQAAYGWAAAAGNHYTLTYQGSNRLTAGDRVFLSSDHNETLTGPAITMVPPSGNATVQLISVNRAGSVPPVAADEQSGAIITIPSGNLLFDTTTPTFWQGVTFTYAGTSLNFGSSNGKINYFRNCAFNLTNTGAWKINTNGPCDVTFDNTSVSFGNVGGGFNSGYSFTLNWVNTPSPIQGAVIPTLLFTPGGSYAPMIVTARGVDFSSITGTLAQAASNWSEMYILLDSCRINPALTRLNSAAANVMLRNQVEMVNCFDGTNVINERNTPMGVVSTDNLTVVSGGPGYSFKLASNARSSKVATLDAFLVDVGNAAIGSPKTATVEIISSAALNNTDIHLVLEYMGTLGTPIASFVTSVGTLSATAALPTSSVVWNSPPATPVKQYLQVIFTPQVAGRVRGLVRLVKSSATVWVNPQIAIA